MPMPRRKYAWEKLSDEQLLQQRLSSLRVAGEGTWLEDCINTLYEELEERASRQYVQHLRLWYAQSHPDEDFAETFAVWLRPRSNWRTRYAGWPALKKLEYVDELMAEIAGVAPLLTRRERVDPLSQLTQTLAEHYRKKQALYAFATPKTYDRDLQRLFSADPRHRRSPAASLFIRRHRAGIRHLVARWTGEYQLTLDALLDDMIVRCRELNLRAV